MAGERGVVLLHTVARNDGALGTAVLLLTPDGALLMGEQGGASPSQRVPRPGTPQRERLEALVSVLRAGQN